jgi:hypothetical protein
MGLSAQTWDGGAGTTNWMDAANWSGDAVPTAASSVSIGSATVVIPSGTAYAAIIGNNGHLTIEAGATLTVNGAAVGGHTFNNGAGSLTNHGTLNISSGAGAFSGLLFQGGVTFNNTGTINLSNIGRRGLTLTGGPATNSGTINISYVGLNSAGLGDGFLFNAGGTFTNSGTIVLGPGISANGLLQNSGTVFNNSGSITITAASSGITGGGTFNNIGSGTVHFGTVGSTEIAANVTFNQASSGTVSTDGDIDNAGTFKGDGAGAIGTFSSTNIMVPGASPGCLNFDSDFATSGSLQVEINGATPCSQFDQLTVAGTATVGGTLTVNFGSFTPNMGQTFQIIDAGGNAGSFSNIVETPATIVLSYTNGVLTVESGGLPVELTSFTARLHDQSVKLDWQTASELNNRGFQVERSTDGKRWTDIGFVAGHGTTAQAMHYYFYDEKPMSGTNYYRLRQMDFDGWSEYSPIVVANAGAASRPMALFPNPAPGGATALYLPEAPVGDAVLEVFDALGRPVFRQSILLAGEQPLRLPIDLHHLLPGSYTVVLRTDGLWLSEKLMISKP